MIQKSRSSNTPQKTEVDGALADPALLPSDEDVRKELEEARTVWLELLRQKTEQTQNPFFVWEAIQLCDAWGVSEEIFKAQDDTEAEDAVRRAVPTPLPDWVLQYLGRIAINITNLARGRDIRALPPFDITPKGQAAMEQWRAGTLTPDEAMRLVPLAMRLTRPGWNAFAAFLSHDYSEWIAERLDDLREEKGLTLAAAAEMIAKIEGYQDPRNILRLAQRGRTKMAKPTG